MEPTAAREYKLLAFDDWGAMAERIDFLLNNGRGWILYGEPFVANETDNMKRLYHQALIIPKGAKGTRKPKN